jgi:hypothetical protein
MLSTYTLPAGLCLALPAPVMKLLPAPPPVLCLPDPARTAFERRLVELLTPLGGNVWRVGSDTANIRIGARYQYWTVVIDDGPVRLIPPRGQAVTFRLTLTPHELRVSLARCKRLVRVAELARLRRDLRAQLFALRDLGPLKMLPDYDGATVHVDDTTSRCLATITGVCGQVRAQEYVPGSLLHKRGPSWRFDYHTHAVGREFVKQVLRTLVAAAVAEHNALLPALTTVAPVATGLAFA